MWEVESSTRLVGLDRVSVLEISYLSGLPIGTRT
jgi:hypothetical protein